MIVTSFANEVMPHVGPVAREVVPATVAVHVNLAGRWNAWKVRKVGNPETAYSMTYTWIS